MSLRLLSRRSPMVRRRRFADPCQHLLRKPFRVALSLPGEIDQFVGYDFFSRLVSIFDLEGGARNLKCAVEKLNSLRIKRVAV
jgi:hypothetical protein